MRLFVSVCVVLHTPPPLYHCKTFTETLLSTLRLQIPLTTAPHLRLLSSSRRFLRALVLCCRSIPPDSAHLWTSPPPWPLAWWVYPVSLALPCWCPCRPVKTYSERLLWTPVPLFPGLSCSLMLWLLSITVLAFEGCFKTTLV